MTMMSKLLPLHLLLIHPSIHPSIHSSIHNHLTSTYTTNYFNHLYELYCSRVPITLEFFFQFSVLPWHLAALCRLHHVRSKSVVAADMRASVTQDDMKDDEGWVYCLPSATTGTRILRSAVTFRATAVLAVATDVRMYVISNNEVK